MNYRLTGWLFVALLFFTAGANTSQAAEKPVNQVLILDGGCCHEWEKISPLIQELLESTGAFQVTITDDREYLRPENIRAFDQVILTTQGGVISEEQKKGLLNFVKNGGGLTVNHAAAGAFRESDDGAVDYFRMLGGKFISHKYKKFRVEIEDPDHPITRNLDAFEIEDEDYIHEFYPESPIHVLLRRPDDNEPVSWVRDYGKGRIFYIALGHKAEAWNNRTFQKILVRGVFWTAGQPARPLPSRMPLYR